MRARSRSSQSVERGRCGSGRHRGQQGGDRHRPAGIWAATWRVWVGRPSASGWPRSARRCRGRCTARSRSTSSAESRRPRGFARTRANAERIASVSMIASGSADRSWRRRRAARRSRRSPGGRPSACAPRVCGCRGRPGTRRTTPVAHRRHRRPARRSGHADQYFMDNGNYP